MSSHLPGGDRPQRRPGLPLVTGAASCARTFMWAKFVTHLPAAWCSHDAEEDIPSADCLYAGWPAAFGTRNRGRDARYCSFG
jgi:hypothetical protein